MTTKTREVDWGADKFRQPFAVYLGDETGFKTLALDFDGAEASRHADEVLTSEKDILDGLVRILLANVLG